MCFPSHPWLVSSLFYNIPICSFLHLLYKHFYKLAYQSIYGMVKKFTFLTSLCISTGLFLTYTGKRIETKNFLISDSGQSDENALICWAVIGRNFRDEFHWNHQLAHESLTKNQIPRTVGNKSFFGWYSSTPELHLPHAGIRISKF